MVPASPSGALSPEANPSIRGTGSRSCRANSGSTTFESPDTILAGTPGAEHGITGFLYYHYWFGGRQMLDRPLREVLESGHPDFPFALCWANESWYRRWQGTVDEMILDQSFSEEDDVADIRWLIECFKDPRYIRIEGRPLLAVYRPHFLPDPHRTVELWRRECQEAGIEPPWLVMFETGDELDDPAALGFDASAEFVPHHLPNLIGKKPFKFGADDSHRMYEYDDVAAAYLDRPPVPWQRYPCVPTAWDNSPRRQLGEALILANSTPESYGRWLAEATTRQSRAAGRNGIVFVNVWNEWAEGAHLEPDAFWGRAYLEATRDVLRAQFGWQPEPDAAEPSHPQPAATDDLYHDLYQKFVALQESSSGLLSFVDRRIRELKTHYETKLGWAKHEAELIVELNDWLVEQLQLQTDRLETSPCRMCPRSSGWATGRPPPRMRTRTRRCRSGSATQDLEPPVKNEPEAMTPTPRAGARRMRRPRPRPKPVPSATRTIVGVTRDSTTHRRPRPHPGWSNWRHRTDAEAGMKSPPA